jgi:hypothetical protein
VELLISNQFHNFLKINQIEDLKVILLLHYLNSQLSLILLKYIRQVLLYLTPDSSKVVIDPKSKLGSKIDN